MERRDSEVKDSRCAGVGGGRARVEGYSGLGRGGWGGVMGLIGEEGMGGEGERERGAGG